MLTLMEPSTPLATWAHDKPIVLCQLVSSCLLEIVAIVDIVVLYDAFAEILVTKLIISSSPHLISGSITKINLRV